MIQRRSILTLLFVLATAIAVCAQTAQEPLEFKVDTGYNDPISGLSTSINIASYSVAGVRQFVAAQGQRDIFTLAVEAYGEAQSNALFNVIGSIQGQLPTLHYTIEVEWNPTAGITKYDVTAHLTTRAEVELVLATIAANIGLFPGSQ